MPTRRSRVDDNAGRLLKNLYLHNYLFVYLTHYFKAVIIIIVVVKLAVNTMKSTFLNNT